MRSSYSLALVGTLLTSTQAWFIPLAPPPPPPASAGCPVLTVKPLGSFLLGPAFPNPYGNINIPLRGPPNCNAVQPAPPPPPKPAPPPPAPKPAAPVCPTGQSCKADANPCASGQSCKANANPCASGLVCLNQANPCASGQSCKANANPCASGQVCLSQANPCSAGQECRQSPLFPTEQASGDIMCNSGFGGPRLTACIDPNGEPTNCCA